MAYESIKFEKKGAIGILTLSRPELKNAMTPKMGEEIVEVVGEINADEDIRSVVFTGAGNIFCAGGDFTMLRKLLNNPPAQSKEWMIDFYNTFLSLRDIKVPTIVAVHGAAMGAGFCLALACDIRVAEEGSKIALNFVRLGLHPGMAATYMVSRAVGSARACELLMTGRTISGREAERIGLVNESVEEGKAFDRAMLIASEIAEVGPIAVRLLKKTIYHSLEGGIGAALEREAYAQAVCYVSDDFKEGVIAGAEKRIPKFKNR